jgi:hypothetical protein
MGLAAPPAVGRLHVSASAKRRRQVPECCACGEKPHHRAPLHVCARGQNGGELEIHLRRRTVAGGLWPPTLKRVLQESSTRAILQGKGFCQRLLQSQSR